MNSHSENEIALTLDVDWAPDFMIDFAAEILVEHGVRATWFVTHDSPALTRLRAQPILSLKGRSRTSVRFSATRPTKHW